MLQLPVSIVIPCRNEEGYIGACLDSILTSDYPPDRIEVLVADGQSNKEVAAELFTRVAGKRIATTVGKRVPLVGGAVGMVADGWGTWRVGRYADKELRPRALR